MIPQLQQGLLLSKPSETVERRTLLSSAKLAVDDSTRRVVCDRGDGVHLRFQSLCFVTEIARYVWQKTIAAFRFRRPFFRPFFRSPNPAQAESQSAGLWTSKEMVTQHHCLPLPYPLKVHVPGFPRTTLFVAAIFAHITSCSLPQSPDLLVSSLRCSPSAFDSFRANTEVRYTLANAATITLYIAQRSQTGELVLVKTLASGIHETKGSHGHTWLGDTHLGVFAEIVDYIAVLQIESSHYEAGVRVFHW